MKTININFLFDLINNKEKVTILKPNDLIPAAYCGVIEDFRVDDWAQYHNCLYITMKPYRCRTLTEIIIDPHETAFILKGINPKSWRKEKIDDTLSRLHRLTAKDFNKDSIVMIHERGDQFLDEFDSLFADGKLTIEGRF